MPHCSDARSARCASTRDEGTFARCTICEVRVAARMLAVGDAFEHARIDAPYASTYDIMLLEKTML